MASFIITGPDGKKYKVTGENAEGALAALKKSIGPSTNVVEQAGTGTSEGIAAMAGFPVDMATKGINAAGGIFGMEPIQNPVGGSEFFRGALDPFMSDAEPQTAGQRIARSIGHDVGAGAVVGPVAGISSLGGLGMNVAADAVSGAVGGAVDEIPGEHPVARALASTVAGAAVPGAFALKRGTGAPSLDDLKAEEGALYDKVRDSEFRLSPHQTQQLQGNVSARMYDEGMFPPADPQATGAISRLYEMPDRAPGGMPNLQDVEDVRQYINQRVMKSGTEAEKALAPAMKQEIDRYLEKLAERNPAAREGVEAGQRAHKVSQKRMKAEEVGREVQNAEWRASTTGLGGNDINALRQNIRRILDDPDRVRGYSKAERDQMQKIVEGTNATNAARFVGQLSPQRSPWLTAMQGGGALYAANPALMAPSAIGIVAQAIGETLTRKQVSDLSAMIRAGKPVERSLTDAEKAVLSSLVAIQGQQQLPE